MVRLTACMSLAELTRPKVPPRESSVWQTPMFEQYWRIREGVMPGTLLFYRMGDFYELFGEDAIAAAPILEIQLTARHKDAEIPVPMCGLPAHSWESYGEKLLRRGQKIALCEQVTPPDSGKLVERKVIRVLTPGLPIDFKHLESKEPHLLFAVLKSAIKGVYDVMACDLLSGALYTGTLESASELVLFFQSVRPKEILICESDLSEIQDQLSRYHITLWKPDDLHEIESFFWSYLEYTQRKPRQALEQIFPFRLDLAELRSGRGTEYAALSTQVISQWDVDPHLFELLDSCGSAMGARTLRHLLHKPLCVTGRIQWRQNICKFLDPVSSQFLISAREVYDLERIMGRFRLEVVKPQELLRLTMSIRYLVSAMDSLDWSHKLFDELKKFESLTSWLEQKHVITMLLERLVSALDFDADLARSKSVSDMFRSGFDAELDQLRAVSQNSEAWLAGFEQKLRDELGISSLKVRHNRVFGFYIEVTKAHVDKVPAHFERRQTMAGAERFSCDELKREEEKILSSSTRLEDRAAFLVQELTKEVLDHDQELQNALKLFSFIDALCGALHSTKKLRRFGSWVYPELKKGSFEFSITDGRHPLVEALSTPGAFVPNSICLNQDKRLLVLTGPNMAGKSTLMRQCGLLVLLAQVGLPVPATSMSLAPCDGFFSRMGASDKILEGESTFMVEMKETAQILSEATSQSLVLVDEIGRGTSTQDGLAIAQSLLEHMHDQVGACTIFATHYHELSERAESLSKAQNASMEIREWKGELIFLRKLVFHPATSSHGIYVAELAGLPPKVLERARNLFSISEDSERIQKNEVKTTEPKLKNKTKPAVDLDQTQLSMFTPPEKIEVVPEWVKKLEIEMKSLDLNEMSPRQAWAFLDQLRLRLEDSH